MDGWREEYRRGGLETGARLWLHRCQTGCGGFKDHSGGEFTLVGRGGAAVGWLMVGARTPSFSPAQRPLRLRRRTEAQLVSQTAAANKD